MRILQGNGIEIHQVTVPREECEDYVAYLVEREGATIIDYIPLIDWDAERAFAVIVRYKIAVPTQPIPMVA